MPTRGYPDFTQAVTHILTGGFAGLEELAARLKSIVPWDMKGNIVLMEDFETEETEWILDEDGGSSLASRQTRHKYSGDWAIKLLADDVADAYASMTRYLHHPGNSKYAFFCRIGCDWHAKEWELGVTFDLFGVRTYANVKFSRGAPLVQIKTSAGAWQAILTTFRLEDANYIFHPLLLILDLTTSKYSKLYLDDVEYDLSTYSLSTIDNLAEKYLSIAVTNRAVEGTGSTIYVDNIVIAKNVP